MKFCFRFFAALFSVYAATSLAQSDGQPRLTVPSWTKTAIWYQVFVERFRNGDATNDPTLHDIKGSWPHLQPTGWAPTPWGHDWYEQEDWAVATGRDFYTTVQSRRYGGDMQGLIDKLDYLAELGVTAIYLNPINDSPSLHKYDARNYRHIDRNFGPDPVEDALIAQSEIPADPSTWKWTAADRLFLKLIEDAHRRKMRIIVDYSWNHTGRMFWAWKDVEAKQSRSSFAGWYDIRQFDDPATPENEFSYRGWAGVPGLPEFRKIPHADSAAVGQDEADLHPELKRHIFAVTKRWLDPDGDGDPTDGVDGFRLDVAELVPMRFWLDYRRFVASINPDAALIAELWWDEWPDRMQDPAEWLKAGAFHAVMNYRWYAPCRSFFGETYPHLDKQSYVTELIAIQRGTPLPNLKAMMNVAATHDTPRLSTSLFNRGQYKYRVGRKNNPTYQVEQPPEEIVARQKLLLVQQFTWIGAPHIYYGDEVGMWGADDPDCRKPMLWDDIVYHPERHLPDGSERPSTPIAPNRELLEFYKRLVAIRRQCASILADGTISFPRANDSSPTLIYERSHSDQRIIVLLNRTSEAQPVWLPHHSDQTDGTALDLLTDEVIAASGEGFQVDVRPLGARVLLLR